MKINTLALQSFRNYAKVDLNFNHNIIFIVGNNAQGKTNLVESIYTLAFSKSYRTKLTKDLIEYDKDFGKINASVQFDNGSIKNIQYVLSNQGKKIKVNNVEQKNKSEFVGLIKVIKFSPEDLNLIKGNPGVRRKFIDMYLSQIDRVYLQKFVQYNHLLKQKKALLKQKNVDETLLKIYNEKLAEYIEIIVSKRNLFITEFQPIVNKVFSNIVDNKEQLTFNYLTAFKEMDKIAIQAYLDEYIDREIKYCGALVGIQKDDIEFLINDKNAKQFGSQGQQRTIVLSLIIALVEYIFSKIGEYPILILDDVMSELDEQRKIQLTASFKVGMQIFLTTTSINDIITEIDDEYELYEVDTGKIKRVGEV